MGLFSKKKVPVMHDSVVANKANLSTNEEDVDIKDGLSVKQVNREAAMLIEFNPEHATHFAPETYSDTKQIADTLIRFKNVTVSFNNTQVMDKKRVIDFLTGVMYALDGDYKKIDNGVYYFWIS